MKDLSDYLMLLAEAAYTFEEYDEFDVDSDEPNSFAIWCHLWEESKQAQLVLVEYVLEHGEELRDWLKKH